MAYPRGQPRQPPSSSSYGGRQAPDVYHQQHNYQHAPQSRDRHERPFQEFSSHPDRSYQESYRSGPNHGSSQWPSEAQQPYNNRQEYAGPTPSHMHQRQDAYQDQMYDQYNAGQHPAAAPYPQDQNASWSGRSPQITDQSHQPRGHGFASHPIENYDYTGPPVPMYRHHAPVDAQRSNGNHVRTYQNPPVPNDPPSQFDQQQRSRPAQDVRSKNATWAQGTTDTKLQQQDPHSGRGKREKRSQLTIDHCEPGLDSKADLAL